MKRSAFLLSIAAVMVMSLFQIAAVSAQEEAAVEATVTAEAEVTAEKGAAEAESLEGIEVDVPEKAPSGLGLWFRNIREKVVIGLTPDPVKKAEKRIQFAEERMRIAEKIAAESDDLAVDERAAKIIEQAQALLDKVNEQKEKWANNPDERAKRLLRNIANHQEYKEQIFDRLEEKVPAEKLERLQILREKSDKSGQRLLNALDNENIPADVREKLQAVKERIDAHMEANEQFRLEREAIIEKIKAGDSSAEAALQALHEERKEKMEEIRQEFKDTTMEFKQKAMDNAAATEQKPRMINAAEKKVQPRMVEPKRDPARKDINLETKERMNAEMRSRVKIEMEQKVKAEMRQKMQAEKIERQKQPQ